MRTFLLLLGQLAQDDLLRDEVDLLVCRRLPQLHEEGCSKVTSADALDFFKLFLVADRQLVLIVRLGQRGGMTIH